MPQLNAYLGFDGNCADAMRFYERVLGARIDAMMTYGQSPMADRMPPASADRVMHARLTLGDDVLMAGDSAGCDQPYEPMKGFSLTLNYPTADEATRIFGALAEGGRITMPLQKTFWAEAFGMLVDRFGTPWIVNGALSPAG